MYMQNMLKARHPCGRWSVLSDILTDNGVKTKHTSGVKLDDCFVEFSITKCFNQFNIILQPFLIS